MPDLLKVHLGCGPNVMPGWVNVDYNPDFNPEVVADLNDAFPFASGTVDFIHSEGCLCQFNLEAGTRFLAECFRILKPGGRLAISDIVATAKLPEEIRKDLALVCACVGGAATIDDTVAMLNKVGFQDVTVKSKDESRKLIQQWAPDKSKNAGDYIVSAYIEAVKPF